MQTLEDEISLSELLTLLCLRGFAGDAGLMAVALGREHDQIEEMMAERTEIDEDLEMKIRRIADERSIDLAP